MPRRCGCFASNWAHYGLIDKLFQRFVEQLWASGLMPKGGQIVDASRVNVPMGPSGLVSRGAFMR